MASLVQLVGKRLASNKTAGVNSKAEFEVLYPTGFLSIDYLNGTSIYVESPTLGDFSYDACGIVDGSTNTIIGRSGAGKSTLMTQIASNIAH
jgi:predicted ATP-dependent serine protease